MGAASSHPIDGDTPPKTALHVLRVIPGSPASLAGIQVFFDFIIGIEGTVTSAIDAHSLEQIVESHEGKTLHLNVWNSKYRAIRPVPIIPSRKWALDAMSSSQQPPANPSLLGLSMRLCEPESALEHVWHILEILEGSPAESAGLVPYGDWIVGWSGGVLSKEGDFYEVVEQHEEKPLRVYVYSLDFEYAFHSFAARATSTDYPVPVAARSERSSLFPIECGEAKVYWDAESAMVYCTESPEYRRRKTTCTSK
ncbi:hypothetical protein FRC01_009206 [Tulasnella sp. 417]|nr:hypothetical protein FRC01_009206 [Tulasnella sp. 417]